MAALSRGCKPRIGSHLKLEFVKWNKLKLKDFASTLWKKYEIKFMLNVNGFRKLLPMELLFSAACLEDTGKV